MVVECRVEVDEVGEEASGCDLAGLVVEVVVGVSLLVVHAAFLFPYLDRENGSGSVAHAFVCGLQQLPDHTAALGGCVGAVVD